MKNIIIIVRKELMDLTRDKRTMLTMVIIPLFIFPLIMSVTGKVTSKQVKKEEEKQIKITIVGVDSTAKIYKMFAGNNLIRIVDRKDIAIFDSLIQTGRIDAAVIINPGFDSTILAGNIGEITIKHKSSSWSTRDKLKAVIGTYKENIIAQRLEKFRIKKEILEPVKTNYIDVATNREKVGNSIGGMVPYIFVIFGFIGCMYPAIDLFTNEKERGTLETILSTPVSRLHILFGKMIVVSIVGLSSALLSIIGLTIGMKQFADQMPEGVMGTLRIFSDPTTLVLLLAMLIPLVIFFAGIMTLITNYARSYKEAQSLLSPLTIFIILPAIIAMMPGMKLSASMALIPIVNICLASKDIIAGTLVYSQYVLVIVSLFIYAALSVFMARIWFGKESNILRI